MDQLFQSDIERILPHRYPFLLVDRVTEFVPGQRIAGVKRFGVDDDIDQGTPAAGIPATILIEAVTQLGAILVLERPEMEGKVAMVLQIPWARMLRWVGTGEDLRVEAETVKLKEHFGELRGAVYRGDELVAAGQMRFAISDTAAVKSLL